MTTAHDAPATAAHGSADDHDDHDDDGHGTAEDPRWVLVPLVVGLVVGLVLVIVFGLGSDVPAIV